MSDDIMNIEQLKQWVKKEYVDHGKIRKIAYYLKHRYQNILNSFYNDEIIPRDFIYAVILGQDLTCPYCKSIRKYYHKTGEMVCKRSCRSRIEKMKKTMKDRYGVDNPTKSPEIYAKIRQTNLKKYGVENPAKSEKIKKKIKNTFIRKYNVDNPMKLECVKNKIRNTNLEKYGFVHPMYTDDIKAKYKQTNLKKYGVEHPMKLEITKSKVKNTWKEKYGTEHPVKLKKIREKIVKTNIEKYGVPYSSQKHYSNETIRFYQERDYAKKIIEKFETLKKISDYLGINETTVSNIIKKHELQNFVKFYHNSSFWEDEIFNFIKQNYSGEIYKNNREIISPYEIDIYIPEIKLGIEFHGLYYHSELFKDKTYHYDKFIKARENGILLIQIFEDEWIEKKNICKSIICNKINVNITNIQARKCKIEELNNETYKKFLETYHIHGYVNAKYKYGLFHNDLVAVISFSPSRSGIGKKNNESFEIVRYAVKNGIRIIGGFEKLLKHFIRNVRPKAIHTYVDNRFFDGHSLKRAGFEFVDYGKPNYWYITPNRKYRLHRFTFAKHKLKNKFGHIFEDIESMTERQIMQELGYLRIYDAGHSKWVYHVK